MKKAGPFMPRPIARFHLHKLLQALPSPPTATGAPVSAKPSSPQRGAHGRQHALVGRQLEPASPRDRLAVHPHGEFSQTAFGELRLDPRRMFDERRHTGGARTIRLSKRAIVDDDLVHPGHLIPVNAIRLQGTSTSLPNCARSSISSWARRASASGSVRSTTARIWPRSTNFIASSSSAFDPMNEPSRLRWR